MKITADGKQLIKGFEACVLKAYLCPAGVWTIGWGHTGPEVHDGLEWTQDQADLQFDADLQGFDAFVLKTCPAASADQHSAMVCLAYNIGMAAFAKSSVARLHNAGNEAQAAQAFALWNKAGGRVVAGLVRRRAAEAMLYLRNPLPPAAGESHPQLSPATAEGERPLGESRTMAGQVGAAAATAGTVAAAKLPDLSQAVTDNRDLVGQILPFVAEYWWVFALIAGGFIGYTMWVRAHDRSQGRS